jgi:hypothetical protein
MSRDNHAMSQMMSQIEFNDFNDVAPSQINWRVSGERRKTGLRGLSPSLTT